MIHLALKPNFIWYTKFKYYIQVPIKNELDFIFMRTSTLG